MHNSPYNPPLKGITVTIPAITYLLLVTGLFYPPSSASSSVHKTFPNGCLGISQANYCQGNHIYDCEGSCGVQLQEADSDSEQGYSKLGLKAFCSWCIESAKQLSDKHTRLAGRSKCKKDMFVVLGCYVVFLALLPSVS